MLWKAAAGGPQIKAGMGSSELEFQNKHISTQFHNSDEIFLAEVTKNES